MKKIMNLRTLLLLSIITFLVSCNDDNDPYEVPYVTFGEVKTVENAYTYIESDLGNTMIVSNPEMLKAAKVESGDRIYGIFTFVPVEGTPIEKAETIRLGYVYKILTKDIVALTPENEKEISDDGIAFNDIWTSGGYLNINYRFFTDGKTVHVLNLVTVDQPKKEEAGYVYVEFRHNANYDYDHFLGENIGIVSFDTEDIVKENPDMKGFILRVNTYGFGERFYKIELNKKYDTKKDYSGLTEVDSNLVE